jgi:hypothetical protein
MINIFFDWKGGWGAFPSFAGKIQHNGSPLLQKLPVGNPRHVMRTQCVAQYPHRHPPGTQLAYNMYRLFLRGNPLRAERYRRRQILYNYYNTYGRADPIYGSHHRAGTRRYPMVWDCGTIINQWSAGARNHPHNNILFTQPGRQSMNNLRLAGLPRFTRFLTI